MIYTRFYAIKLIKQMIRFGVVGLMSNVLLYVLYLFFTVMGMGHKTAMTLLFVAGTLQTFVFNKHWTFEHQGIVRASFAKYLLTYFFAYILNLAALFFFADQLGYEHQIVQGLMIVFIAVVLFILQRYWIFRASVSSRNY